MKRKVTQASLPAGKDAPLRVRTTVRVYRADRFGMHVVWNVKLGGFCYTIVHVGWWYVNIFDEGS